VRGLLRRRANAVDALIAESPQAPHPDLLPTLPGGEKGRSSRPRRSFG
jgi:hypothetical protein